MFDADAFIVIPLNNCRLLCTEDACPVTDCDPERKVPGFTISVIFSLRLPEVISVLIVGRISVPDLITLRFEFSG